MDGLKGIILMLLLFASAVLVLAGLAAAEPQPVDGGWHRSDEVPVETPTAAPPDGEQHSADEEPAPSGIDADAAATTAAEPQPGNVVSDADAAATMEPEAAERRVDVGRDPIHWAVFICMGLAVSWIVVRLIRWGVKR